MLSRVLSALVLIPAVLALVYFAPAPLFMVALAGAGSLCMRELLDLTTRLGLPARPWAAHGGLWFLLLGLGLAPLPAAAWPALAFLGLFAAALGRASLRDGILGLVAEVFGVAYLGVGLYPLYSMRFGFGESAGRAWIILLLVTIWVGDSAALFAGRAFGRTSFAPRLSPKKTNEGAVAGLLAGTMAAVAVAAIAFPEIPLRTVAWGATLAGAAGQLGDLAESMLKRAAQVKDSSHLIPGHGGALDRVDSLLFAAPALHGYLLLLQVR